MKDAGVRCTSCEWWMSFPLPGIHCKLFCDASPCITSIVRRQNVEDTEGSLRQRMENEGSSGYNKFKKWDGRHYIDGKVTDRLNSGQKRRQLGR